jgi:hypothetical protein
MPEIVNTSVRNSNNIICYCMHMMCDFSRSKTEYLKYDFSATMDVRLDDQVVPKQYTFHYL